MVARALTVVALLALVRGAASAGASPHSRHFGYERTAISIADPRAARRAAVEPAPVYAVGREPAAVSVGAGAVRVANRWPRPISRVEP